jgi:hypothetical protein
MRDRAIGTFAALMVALLLVVGCSDEKLVDQPSLYTVTGYVTRSDNGGGIPKVVVTIDGRSYRTSFGGYYEIKRLTPGEYTLTARKECCYYTYQATLTVNGIVNHDISLAPRVSDENQ